MTTKHAAGVIRDDAPIFAWPAACIAAAPGAARQQRWRGRAWHRPGSSCACGRWITPAGAHTPSLFDDNWAGTVREQLGDRGGQQHRGRVGIERPAGALRKVLHELLAALVPSD